MKAFTISTVITLFAALSHAAPLEVEKREVDHTIVTFDGADKQALYTESFPLDGTVTPITNRLSVSYIEIHDPVFCIFHGVDGGVNSGRGPITLTVGPPQAQVSGQCFA